MTGRGAPCNLPAPRSPSSTQTENFPYEKSNSPFFAAAALATAAFAQDKKAPDAKGVVAGEITRVVSTVEAIDQATRVVTLRARTAGPSPSSPAPR